MLFLIDFSCIGSSWISPIYLSDIAIRIFFGPQSEKAITARRITSIRAGFILKKISFSRAIEMAPSTRSKQCIEQDEPVYDFIFYIVKQKFSNPESQSNIKTNHSSPDLIGKYKDEERD